jgi:hypothetical protein
MSRDLKKLVAELERVFAQRGSLLDAPAQDEFQARIDDLKKAVEETDAAEMHQLRVDSLNLLAALLSVITNVISLLR